MAGQFGSWRPIGAEQVTGGYNVAWYDGSNQYSIWMTNSNGVWLSNTGGMSGADLTLQNYETTFQQDLNGDGRIGPPPPTFGL